MIEVKIYYEDTDLGGVVYYANYLKYFERARTEYLLDKGINLPEIHKKDIIFAVRNVEVEYLKPACYGDILIIETELEKISKYTLNLSHSILKKNNEQNKKPIVLGKAKLVCINNELKIRPIPENILKIFK